MSKTKQKRFMVKVFRFETRDGGVVCRHMLTDNQLPMLVPNQYIAAKSMNKAGTGRNHAWKLAVFFNYLDESYQLEYDGATNRHVCAFLSTLIYGDTGDLRITAPQEGLSYSTLSGYLGAITTFYRWLDQNYGSAMTFYEGERKCRSQSYLYGQIYTYQYKYLVDRLLPDVKGSRNYVKWYSEEEKRQLCQNFCTLRDEAIFRLTLEGFRIDEVLSMCLSTYNAADQIIQPTRSKMRQSAVRGAENRLRKVRIAEETCRVLDRYIYEERTTAENKSGIISDWMFLNLNSGGALGKPLSYANYRKILRRCAWRAGLDARKIRTHSGRSTKVMDLLEDGALYPERKLSDLEFMLVFGWRSIDSIMPYMNHNSEIMANAAYDRHQKDGDGHD